MFGVWCEAEVLSLLFQSWPDKHHASSCSYWYLWCLNTTRGCSTVILNDFCFAGTFKVSISKTTAPYCTSTTFRSLKLFANIKIQDASLSIKWYRSFPSNVGFASVISMLSASVLHGDIAGGSKWARYRLVLLNKPMFPAVSVPGRFLSATHRLRSAHSFSASSINGKEQT